VGGHAIVSSRRGDSEPTRPPPRRGAVVRTERESWLPGTPLFWVGLAVVVFALAVGLAFGLNGGGEGEDSAGADEAAATSLDPGAAPLNEGAASDPQPSGDNPSAGAESPPVSTNEDGSGTNDGAAETLTEGTVPASPVLTGFAIPIPDACISEFEGHQPNSLREYRNGIHEGLDFYEFGSCVPLGLGSVVIAAKDGLIVRADGDYTELTQAELDAAEAVGYQGEEVLDLLRGRQVWIDHGGGVVTRYAHLSAVAAGVVVGALVVTGDIIGFVGESGSPTSLESVETDFHLHFEIRVGDAYLGEGLSPLEGRQLYLEAFSPGG